jgi:hypothetical protein
MGWEAAHGQFRLGRETAAFAFDQPEAEVREEAVAPG